MAPLKSGHTNLFIFIGLPPVSFYDACSNKINKDGILLREGVVISGKHYKTKKISDIESWKCTNFPSLFALFEYKRENNGCLGDLGYIERERERKG